MVTDEELLLNQKFIDLVNEYFDDPENQENYEQGYWVDGKALMKHFWNAGYKIVARMPLESPRKAVDAFK